MNQRTPCDCAFCWRPKKMWRTPDKLPIIHLIEALADSGNQSLVHDNKAQAHDRFNRILKVTREIIISYPESGTGLFRCKFYPPGTKAKCGMPLVDGICNYHGDYNRQERLDRFLFGGGE